MDNEEANQLIDLFFGETGKKISKMTEQEKEDLINKALEVNK